MLGSTSKTLRYSPVVLSFTNNNIDAIDFKGAIKRNYSNIFRIPLGNVECFECCNVIVSIVFQTIEGSHCA